MKLRWIQRYVGGYLSPPCEFIDNCNNRAVGMWVDPDGHAHDLCKAHASKLKAPPMEDGIIYAPAHSRDYGTPSRRH